MASSTPEATARRPRKVRQALTAAVIVLLAAAIGGVCGAALLGNRVTAQARLVVGDQTIQAQSVPGYALATQQLAGTYARLATGDAVTSRLPAGAEVTASPVPDSAVVLVEAEAGDEGTAVQAADAAAAALTRAVQGIGGATENADALRAYQQAKERLRQARTAVGRAGEPDRPAAQDVVEFRQLEVEALGQAHREQVRAGASGSAGLAVTQNAVVTRTSTPRAGALGAVTGAALALLVLGAIHLARRRGPE